MHTLCISVTFLEGLYHGRADYGPEWPPSPFRLFQALLASAARNGWDQDDAFQWLERQAPPIILAPRAIEAQPRTTYVPNNDSDKILDRQKRLAGKKIAPYSFNPETSLHYIWSINQDDTSFSEKIVRYAQQLSAFGWGIDIVAGNGRILSNGDVPALKESYPGRCWDPMGQGKHDTLRCPQPGSLDDLRSTYQTSLHRFNGDVYRRAKKPHVFREVMYQPDGVKFRHYAAFKLLDPEDDSGRMAQFDPRRAMYVAAWVRSRACDLAKKGSFPGNSEIYVAGHVPEEKKQGPTPPRFSYLPIPSIGDTHADGKIRRIIIAEPFGGDGSHNQWASRILPNSVLTDKENNPKANLQTAWQEKGVVRQYTKLSRRFRTVTPVILPGRDDRKYLKAQKLILKAIEQAGLACDELEDMHLQKAPFWPGAFAPADYARPKYLQDNSAIHVELVWKNAFKGPLAIGAGRHLGLGLFAAEKGCE